METVDGDVGNVDVVEPDLSVFVGVEAPSGVVDGDVVDGDVVDGDVVDGDVVDELSVSTSTG